MGKYIKKALLHACAYYTATTYFLLLLYFILNRDLTHGIKPLVLLLILPFALMFSVANLLFRYGKFPQIFRVLIHYALTMTGIWCFLFLPNKASDQPASSALVLFLALTFIYALIMLCLLLIQQRASRIRRDESEYQSVYKK